LKEVQSKLFSANKTLNFQGKLMDLSVPKVMGILNVTPDSFYEGSRFAEPTAIKKQVEKMIEEGADFIDVGGYSSRPGATDVSQEDELHRVVPVVQFIRKEFPSQIISIDTFRPEVAKQAVQVGASMVNDISGGQLDNGMLKMVAELKVPYIAMHMRGTPQTMMQETSYENLIKDMTDYFHKKLEQLHLLGVKDVIIDPGFGFSKTADLNFQLLNHLDYLHILGKPMLIGLSRKSMIWRTLNTTPEAALNGSTALHVISLLKGASILRVHDVREAVETIKLVHKTLNSSLNRTDFQVSN
jgi:dihydropteroate synthase